jgi:hypothetical protein
MPREVHPAYTRITLPILVAPALTGIADGTGAITLIDSLPLGFKGIIEKITFVSGSIATGASASQVFKVRKGGASGSVVATLTLALADVNAVGKFKSASVASADAETAKINTDTETLSLTRDAGGTAYTKFEGVFYITIAQRLQARQ